MFLKVYTSIEIRKALDCYERVNSLRKAAKITGVSKSTIQRWHVTFYKLMTSRSKHQVKKRRCQRKRKYPLLFLYYCRAKLSRSDDITKIYSNPMFRQFKFLTYCKSKSSEKKFMNEVKKTFGPSNAPNNHIKCMRQEEVVNASKSQNHLTIAWGNWGKTPNALKNGAPTPGIGIRRRFEKEFKVVVTCEHLTSQNCPCCGSQRSLKKPSLKGLVRHHLLRCENVNCMSRWWNRNVAGSLNILFRALGTECTPENEALGASLRESIS